MNKSLQEEMDRLLTPWLPKQYETMRNEFAMNGRDTEYSPDNKMSILRELERKKRMISAASAPGKCRYLCKFCKKNGESERVYISHNLKDDNGLILCPILRNYTCPHCHASGDRAHTVKYCSLPRYYY
ncbi:nanos [Carabus blaptoides fortunei]